MTSVLVVDDSAVARALVTSLLREGSGLEVAEAEDGVDAMQSISRSAPDIVVTDLHMPNMNGLQLVESIRADFEQIPVVLITGQGSEELAVNALKSGAASYVPKAVMSDNLLSTVLHVLALSRASHETRRLKSCWTENRCTFTLDNDMQLVPPLIAILQETTQDIQLLDRTQSVQLGMAVQQAISNSIYHGNLELTNEQLDSIEYDLSDDQDETIVAIRKKEQPYRDRKVQVQWTVTRAEARISIRDEGPGFDDSVIPSPEELLASDKLSGRGITYMRLFSDEIIFNDRGNEVTLIKRGNMPE